MRWSAGGLLSRRGAGLGNEIFPWAKAYLGARALGLKVVDPPWRINSRRYDRELDSGAMDSLGYMGVRVLPAQRVDASVLSLTSDYYEAMLGLAPTLQRGKAVLLHTSGMAGGYLAIRRARPFLRSQLLSVADASRVLEVQEAPSPATLRVGVHIRAGDFHTAQGVSPGQFNVSLPLAWFANVLATLEARTALPVQVVLATDTPTSEVRQAATLDGVPPTMLGTNSVGDLAALTSCDVIISSVSSFSMLSIFLSDAPYVWHEPHLTELGGWLSIWGGESGPTGGGIPTARSQRVATAAPQTAFHRGIAVGLDPIWPQRFVDYIEARAMSRSASHDLLMYGVVRNARDE